MQTRGEGFRNCRDPLMPTAISEENENDAVAEREWQSSPIEPHSFVPQGSEVAEIPAGSAAKIKDRIRRVTLYRVEERRVVLADIVMSRAAPESPGKSIVIRDRHL